MAARVYLSAELDRVHGVVSLTVTNDSTVALERIPLWSFPNRLAKRNPKFNDINMDWSFPGNFSPGGMTLEKVVSDGKPLQVRVRKGTGGTVHDVALVQPLKPGAKVTLDVFFATTVPHRFGPFGHANEQLTLDGGFLPRTPPLGPKGFVLDAPPDALDFELHGRWLSPSAERPALVVVNGRVSFLPGDGKHHRLGGGRARRVTLTLHTEHTLSTLKADGTYVALFHRRPRRLEPRPGDGLRDLTAIDTHANILASVGSGIQHFNHMMKRVGSPIRAPRRVVVVECSLRRDLAIGSPDMLLVSDRAFELLETERLQKFQRMAIIRQLFNMLLDPTLGPRHGLRARDRVVDLAALHATNRWEKRLFGASDSAQELLSGGSFVSLVDEALYAPQLPFQSVYFASIDDTDRLRDRFTLFSHNHSNGRRWLEKLRDRVKPRSTELDDAVDVLLRGGSLADALTRVKNAAVADLEQWNGRDLAMNYILEKVEPGRDGEGDFVDVTVARKGSQVREPVTVRTVDEEGRAAEGTWKGESARGTVRVRTRTPVDKVELDPRQRLMERDLGENIDPHRDNRNFDEWKFLVQGFSLAFSSAEGRLEATVVSFLQPKYDLTHLISLEPYFLANRAGVFARYLYFFGDKVRPNRRRFNIFTSLRAEWLMGNATNPDGLGVQLAVGFGDADQLSKINPGKSHNLYASVAASMAWLGEAPDWSGALRVGYSRVETASEGHRLGFRLEAATVVGQPRQQQEWVLGGVTGVRAFDPLAQTGRHRLLLQAEWRHRLTRDVVMNVAQLGFVTRIDGVLHFDAAMLSPTYEDFFSLESVYLGVGYGFRFFYLLFGMNPMLVTVDFAVPVFAGTPLRTSSAFPLSLVLSIDQTF